MCGKEIYHDFERSTPIKEVKRVLIKKYQELGINSHNIDKEIEFYCDENPIKNENEQIGNIADGAELNLEMISISLNSSSKKDIDERQKKVIDKLSKNCKFHSGNKELLICITCGISFCSECIYKHQAHQKLYKTELISQGKEIKKISEEINNIFLECEFSEYTENNLLCKEEKQRLNANIENMQKMVDEIKKTFRNLNNSFKKIYDDFFPFIMDYKEKINKLNERSSQFKTMRNEQDFINYYNSYSERKSKEKKIFEYINKVKTQFELYKEIIKEFYSGTNRIIEKLKEDYNMLINLDFHENKEKIPKSNFNTLRNMRTSASFNKRYLRGDIGRMNLRNMLLGRDKLLNNEKILFIKKKLKRQTEVLKINDENPKNDTLTLNLVFWIEPNTKNLFIYDKTTNKITKIYLNFTGLPIENLLNYFGTLNYMGRFYLSGGIQYPKNFYRLDAKNKSFIQLRQMPSGHNFHGMIGIGNNIFSVSGFKNPNVEKYDLSTNSWTSLPPLGNCFSWPQCLSIEDRFLYVFGDISGNKKIYKMDIINSSANWQILDVISNLEKMPFFSGLIQLGPKNALVLGGKFSSFESNTDQCFDLNFENNSFNQNKEYKLPNGEVFNGKRFYDLGNGLFGEFSCFSYNKFYLVNTSSKTIDVIH